LTAESHGDSIRGYIGGAIQHLTECPEEKGGYDHEVAAKAVLRPPLFDMARFTPSLSVISQSELYRFLRSGVGSVGR
jgi:hypothetical protein